MRTISRVVTPTPISMKTSSASIFRVIGTVDVDGKGTVHPLADASPFIFLDDAFFEGEVSSVFNKHPHKGLVAVTYLLEGSVHAWDNINGATPFLNHAGGVYCVNTGRGIVHGEAAIEGIRKVRLLQLWFQPVLDNDLLPKASYQLFQPDEVPVFEDNDFSAKVIIGEGFGVTSPVNTPWPVQYLHIKLKGNMAKTFNIPNNTWSGFIYIINGRGKFGANVMEASLGSCLVLGPEDSDNISIQNITTDSLEFILATGKSHNKPFVKLLGHGGAIISDTEENARAAMRGYEADPEHFGM